MSESNSNGQTADNITWEDWEVSQGYLTEFAKERQLFMGEFIQEPDSNGQTASDAPGLGEHASDGEPNTCVEPHGEHECGRTLWNGKHKYLPTFEHRCSCGFTWMVTG